MNEFIVSARKYRPQDFASVVGQSHITTTLKNAIRNNQLAHAFLFCGPRGVGKTTCARILAKTINCSNLSPEGEACNKCDSCRSFNQGTSYNIHELDGASNNSVEDIRTLTEQVRFVPQSGKYKVYIIDEVHMLSTAAFNAFLKTLEEPPPYAIFILATTEKHKIIPTILSRCQIFDFRRISVQDSVTHLQEICKQEQISADPDALHLIALKSEGCMRDALGILDKMVSFTNGNLSYQSALDHLNILDYEYFFRVIGALRAQDMAQTLQILDEILLKGFEADNFLNGFASFLRDLLVCQDDRVAYLLEVAPNLRDRYKKEAASNTVPFLLSSLQVLSEAEGQFRQSRNKRLLVELTLLRLCYLRQAVQLVSNPQSGEVIQNQVTGSGKVQKLRGAFLRPISERKTPGDSTPENLPMLTIQEPSPSPKTPSAPRIQESLESSTRGRELSGKLPGLKDLKSSLIGKDPPTTELSPVTLDEKILMEKWNNYISRLIREDKLSMATHLRNARISITGEREVEIRVSNPVQQKFIEEDKLQISAFLKRESACPQLIVGVRLELQGEPTPQSPPVLSSREQYQLMIKKYPLVKELRDRLNLEIDY